jgi:hypothetical protein
MMALSLSYFVNKDVIGPLAWMGRHRWLGVEPVGEKFSLKTIKTIYDDLTREERAGRPTEFWQTVRRLLYSPYANDKDLLMTYAYSRSACGGPKVFRPTSLQCQSLENTTVDIPWGDYHQNYEVLFVEFPQDYIELKLRQGLKRCPKAVVCWYDEQVKVIVVNCQFGPHHDRIISLLAEQPGSDTIEKMLSQELFFDVDGSAALDTDDFNVSITFERLAVNLNLLMTYGGGSIVVTRDDRKRFDELTRLRKRAKHVKGARGEKERNTIDVQKADLMQQIQFDREIEWFATVDERLPRDGPECEGNSPEPHWRRGHWRNQMYGPRTAPLHKRIRIAPVYVIGQAYRDIDRDEAKARTTTTYVQKGEEFVPELPTPDDTPPEDMKEAV